MSHARQSLARWAALAAVAAVAVTGAASAAQASPDPDAPVTVFDSMPSPLPGNYSSHAFLATSTTEAGDVVQLAPGNRTLDQVTVAMSSWACGTGGWSTGDCVTEADATFTHDLTLKVYGLVDGVLAAEPLTTITQSFAMPYRPSSDPTNCGRHHQVPARSRRNLLQRQGLHGDVRRDGRRRAARRGAGHGVEQDRPRRPGRRSVRLAQPRHPVHHGDGRLVRRRGRLLAELHPVRVVRPGPR